MAMIYIHTNTDAKHDITAAIHKSNTMPLIDRTLFSMVEIFCLLAAVAVAVAVAVQQLLAECPDV